MDLDACDTYTIGLSPSAATGPCEAVGAASAYRATQRVAATPRRLRVLLYDSAIRLCRQALTALDDGEIEPAAERLAKAMRSVHQLRNSLPDGCGHDPAARFAELYDRVQNRLIEADFYRRRESVSETISILSCRRVDWHEFARTFDEEPAELPGASSRSWLG